MKAVFAIGGGEMEKLTSVDSLALEIARQNTGKETAQINLLILPTAGGDGRTLIKRCKRHYRQFGIEPIALSCTRHTCSQEELKALVFNQDMIYVGGGNTQFLIDTWNQCGLSQILIEAYHRGIVLIGTSAGAMCWFEQGYSYDEQGEQFRWVQGLSLFQGTFCPHAQDRPQYQTECRQFRGPHYAVENEAVVMILEDEVKFISCNESARAYLVESL